MYFYKSTITFENTRYLQLAEKDLEAKEPVYERILQNGHSLLDETEDGPEKDAVQQRLDELTNTWNDIKDKSNKRSDDIGRLYPLASAHNDDYVTFSVYLTGAEKKLDELDKPCIDEKELERQQKELEVCFVLFFLFLCLCIYPWKVLPQSNLM